MFPRVTPSLRGYQPIPDEAPSRGDVERHASDPSARQIRQGDYQHNLKILDEIFSDKTQKKSHLKEVFRKEGVDFAIDTLTTAMVTAATYFVTTAMLSKTQDMAGMLLAADRPSSLQLKINELLADPAFQAEMAAFMVKAKVVADVGTTLVLVQSLSSAFSHLGSSVGALLKALCHPQEGQAHEAQLKLLAFRRIMEKTTPALDKLPPEIQVKAREALEHLKGEILRMNSAAGARDANDVKKAADLLFAYFALPLEVENTYQMNLTGQANSAEHFNKKQRELVGTYDEPLRSQLDYIMTLFRYATINPAVRPINVWMEGPTSTGKTYFVEQFAPALNATLRKMTVYEYLEMRGQPVFGKTKEVPWDAPLLEAVGPWRDTIVTARTRNAVNLVDEVKFFNLGDADDNLDAVEQIKKARNPDNIAEIPVLRVKFDTAEINFFNSNYPMDLPLPDKEAEPEKYEIVRTANEAFIKSFIHIRFKNWSEEKLAERLDEKVERMVQGMRPMHARPVVDAANALFEELKPLILAQAKLHNPSEEMTRITLKEVHAVVNKLSVHIALELDAANKRRQEQGGAGSAAGTLLKLDDEQMRKLRQMVVDDFKLVADSADALNKGLQAGKARGDEQDDQASISSANVIARKSDEEIVTDMQAEIAKIKESAKNAPTREEVEERLEERDAALRDDMQALIARAVDEAKGGESSTAGRGRSISERLQGMHLRGD